MRATCLEVSYVVYIYFQSECFLDDALEFDDVIEEIYSIRSLTHVSAFSIPVCNTYSSGT